MHDWSEQRLVSLITQALKKQSESHLVEFKEATGGSPHKSLWKTISAFSNSSGGGIIAFGVKENADRTLSVGGVENLQSLQEALFSYISEKMVNCGKYALKPITLEGKQLLVLAISELAHKEKPCYYKDLGVPRGACVRIGNVDKQITQEELTTFLQHSPSYTYDQTILTEVNQKDFSSTKVDKFFQKSAERTGRVIKSHLHTQTFLELHLLAEKSNDLHPTLAGYLFFADRPPQHLFELSRYFVQCVKYAGTTPASPILDKQEIDGTLDEQVEKSHRFILENIHVRADIVGAKRVDTYDYPSDALREVVINALTHRDYSNVGTLVNISVFSNRVEVTNPGGLPPGYDMQDLKEFQFSRNSAIAQVMRSLNYIEEFGRGIDLLYLRMNDWGLPQPLFSSNHNMFKVILLGESFRGLTERQIQLWYALKLQQSLTANKASDLFPEISRRSINDDLKAMTSMGLLLVKGASSSTYYEAAF